MADRTCERCARTYAPSRPTQRFCSVPCRRRGSNARQRAKSHIIHPPRSCAVCRASFQPKYVTSRTCSIQCRNRSYYKPRDRWHDKTCSTCSAQFRSKRSDAMYCGHQCAVIATYDSVAASTRAAVWAKANPERVRAIKMRNKLQRKAVVLTSPGVSNRDWLRLLNRYDNLCAYCGSTGPLHMDHVVPLARGGRHQIGNVLPACAPCNLSKNARLLAAWKRGR